MRINTNIAALNSYNRLRTTQNNLSSSLAKLSSGKRINKAADDAAGLAISEKMKAQTRGLAQAQRNAQDGISMIQTAEGALKETHSILQRMRELADQSANGTNTADDRANIQDEISQLKDEIDRISDTTEFNTQSLLKGDGGVKLDGIGIDPGTISAGKLTGGAELSTTEAQNTDVIGTAADDTSTATFTISGQTIAINFADEGTSSEASNEGYNVTQNSASVNIANGQTVNQTASGIRDALQKVIDNNSVLKDNYVVSGTGADVTVTAVKDGDFAGAAGTIGTTAFSGGTIAGTAGGGDTGTTTAPVQANSTLGMPVDDVVTAGLEGKGITINGEVLEFYDATKGVYEGDGQGIDIGGITTKVDLTNAIVAQAKVDGVTLANDGSNDLLVTASQGGTAGNDITVADGGVQEDFQTTFQIGANSGQTMDVSIGNMGSKALGVDDLDVTTSEDAQAALDALDSAISTVSSQRSSLGAVQNRLNHTINNLSTSEENLTAAESRISDVDMAKEMMSFTKNQILSQAGTAMLAQANQLPQGVLQLLQ